MMCPANPVSATVGGFAVLGAATAHIMGMTTTTATVPQRPRSAVTEYDTARRKDAASGAGPTKRMTGPSVPTSAATSTDGSASVLFWLSHNKLVCSAGPTDPVHPATAQIIGEAFTAVGVIPVATDRLARARMLRTVEQSGGTVPVLNDLGASTISLAAVARQMRFTTTFPANSRLVVLADALARKYWLPAGLDTTNIEHWRRAFGMTADVASLQTLVGMVTAASGNPSVTFRALLAAEAGALKSIIFPGTGPAARAFTSAEKVGEAWSATERTDPLLRHRCIVEGTVARVRLLHRNGSTISGSVSQPFRLREGEVLGMFDDTSSENTARIVLVSMGFTDTLVAEFGPVTSKNKQRRSATAGAFAFMDSALAAHETVLVTNSPYLSSAPPSSTNRWTGKPDPAETPIARDVPLDVVLAGAPSE